MSDRDQLPERSKIVSDALAGAGLETWIRALDGSTRTAADAAHALDCAVGAIASSLVFVAGQPGPDVATLTDPATDSSPSHTDSNDTMVLVMTSGRHRVDTELLATCTGAHEITRATPDQVRAATGQAIGGVAPVGHPQPLRTIIDTALADYPLIWAAGGTPRTVFPLTYNQLIEITNGTPATVGPD